MKHWTGEDYATMEAALKDMIQQFGLEQVKAAANNINNLEENFRVKSLTNNVANRIAREGAQRYEVRLSDRTDGGMNIYDTVTGAKVFDNGDEAEIREWLERNA